MILLDFLTHEQFMEKLNSIHGKVLYEKRWSNYPDSIFYYTEPIITGTEHEVGIWTDSTHYYIKRGGFE